MNERYIDFYLIGELVDSHGNVHYEDLKNLPIADVVEVVRCKDCRYWQEYQEGHYPNELCPWDKNETTDEDDYCSYGERGNG